MTDSNLNLDKKTCTVCGGTWLNGKLHWATGAPAKELDLAALVCNKLPLEKKKNCINSCLGKEGGIGWEERMNTVNQALDGLSDL